MSRHLFYLVLVVAAGCQSTPALLITPAQHQEIRAISSYVTYQAKAMRRDNMVVTRETIERLLREQDSGVKTVLNSEQWQLYDSVHRQRLASSIYQTEIRPPSPLLGGPGDITSMPVSSGQQR